MSFTATDSRQIRPSILRSLKEFTAVDECNNNKFMRRARRLLSKAVENGKNN